MISLLNLFKNKKIQAPQRNWDAQFEQIQNEWNQKGIAVQCHTCSSYDEFKNVPLTGEKNEIHLAVLPWESRNADIVKITKHNISFEYPLQTYFENLSQDVLLEMGILPTNTICDICGETSSNINFVGNCDDCEQ